MQSPGSSLHFGINTNQFWRANSLSIMRYLIMVRQSWYELKRVIRMILGLLYSGIVGVTSFWECPFVKFSKLVDSDNPEPATPLAILFRSNVCLMDVNSPSGWSCLLISRLHIMHNRNRKGKRNIHFATIMHHLHQVYSSMKQIKIYARGQSFVILRTFCWHSYEGFSTISRIYDAIV